MDGKRVASVALALLIVGLLLILAILSFTSLTTRETGLMSTILTLLSILATCIVAFVYSESIHKSSIQEAKDAHKENLRTYALKAAEKVTNLSDQLSQLSDFLEVELRGSSFDTVQELVNSREQRIVSAIQMLAMLKSVNDTALSDWQGVIGEELEEKREEKEELQEHVLDLTDRLEKMVQRDEYSAASKVSFQDDQLGLLREDLSKLIGDITGRRPVPVISRKSIRRDVVEECPKCGGSIQYRQKAKNNTAKKVECKLCKNKFVSKFDSTNKKFYLELNEDLIEKVECESCKNTISAALSTFPGSATALDCEKCKAKYRMIRTVDGTITLRRIEAALPIAKELTPDLLEKVKLALPDQPWERGIHKAVANEVGLSNSLVTKAIRKLIEDGTFNEQIDGELYELKPIGKGDS